MFVFASRECNCRCDPLRRNYAADSACAGVDVCQKTRNLPPQTDYDVDDDDDDDDAVMYICIRVLLVTISSY